MNTIIYFLLISSLTGYGAIQDSPSLRFGYSEACPHMCPNEVSKGFVTDIVRVIYESRGYKVSFVSLPWARATSYVLHGKLDGMLSASKLEVPQMVFPNLEVAMQNDCFIGRYSDAWQPSGLSSFIGRRTLVFKGWFHETNYIKALGKEKYRKFFISIPLDQRYPSRAVKMIKRQRVESFWMDENVYEYYRRNLPIMQKSKLRNLGCVAQQKLYLAISPAHRGHANMLAQKFDQGMTEIRNSGELVTILSRYGLHDWIIQKEIKGRLKSYTTQK
jgi:polar amino acid transport system substrate-binding protein